MRACCQPLGNKAGQAKISAHLNPSCGSLHKWCERKGLDWLQVEKMVHGLAGNKRDLSEEMAVGYIMDLDTAENNETTSKGLIKIEVGPHKGKVVRFNRWAGWDLIRASQQSQYLSLQVQGESLRTEAGEG